MNKNLISEIHRIHEIMGVKSKNLILESSCPFCVKFLKEIDDLIVLLKKGDLDLAGFTSKIDDLESKIDDMALSINEKQALKTKIQKAKSTGITDGDTFRNLLKQEFDRVDQFKSTLDSTDATKIDTVAVMKDPKTAQLSFDSPNSKTELAEIELSFTKPETEKLYKDTFSTLDEVANHYESYFREILTKKGYPAEFIENYVSIWKNWVKNNETLKKWFNTKTVDLDEPQNVVTKDFKPPKLEDVKFKPALIEVYNTKTKMYDMYRVNLPDRIVPGRTKEDVAFKMKNLRKDLGIDYLTHNWRKRMGGNPISLTKDSGIVYDGKTGRLYDSNTRYWLNIEYGNIPKADELNYSYSNTIAKDNGKLIGSNTQSQLKNRIEYLNLPKTSSWDEGFDDVTMENYINFIRSN
jgi:hypothetical protein